MSPLERGHSAKSLAARPPVPWRFARYASVGIVGTTAHYVVLIGLVQGSGLHPVPASTAGAVLGTLVNYALNYHFTFNSSRSHRRAFPRFVAVAGVGVLINAAVLALSIDALGLNYLVGQVIATGVVLLTGFLANHRWTF